jgi:glycerol-1-phosphate dehydrogenase [NAD(P)+]
MPLLTRMVGVPLWVDIRPGAAAQLASLLADRRISAAGDVAIVVGPGQGEAIAAQLAGTFPRASVMRAQTGTVDAAQTLATNLRSGFYDAVVGIGGGRLLDTVKWAATHTGLPMIAVATNLAHDGIASPVASLEHRGRKGSFGVQVPLAVVVDLDLVRRAPPRMLRSGIGDLVSNLTALTDWELAAQVRGEPMDGMAAAFARTAALAILRHEGSIEDDSFLGALAEGLVLSGLAMSVAGSSRPCSGGEHEIVHAVTHLFPEISNHGELAALGAVFAASLQDDQRCFRDIVACLRRHDLPTAPAHVGLSDQQFLEAVLYAPATRPDRYTILEHLALSETDIAAAIAALPARVEAATGTSGP